MDLASKAEVLDGPIGFVTAVASVYGVTTV